MAADEPYVPFSQRTGLAPIPPQLQLGEVSKEFRRLVNYAVSIDIDDHVRTYAMGAYFTEPWDKLSKDLHVHFFQKDISEYNRTPSVIEDRIRKYIYGSRVASLLDLIEYLVRHHHCSRSFGERLRKAFVDARMAYRIVDRQIVAIGSDEQAKAYETAVADAEREGAGAARQHLLAAGVALRDAQWAGCVRECAHAVESISIFLEPNANKLSHALEALEQRGRLHSGLKRAFGALYGYASDEEGVRHSLVFQNEANVDEADALFMLGACASFVSYVLARSR